METASKLTIVFLHGFGGTHFDFDEIISFFPSFIKTRTITLSGHEKTPPLNFIEDEIERLASLLAALQNGAPLLLCGYSMGGRLATLLSQKINIDGLILLSSGIGENPETKEIRQKKDQEWAQLLKTDSTLFYKKWYAQDLFKNFEQISPLKKEKWLELKTRHDPKDLAIILEQFGPTKHLELSSIIKKQKNVLYLSGELDKKYTELGKKLKNDLTHLNHEIIKDVGHLLPLEAPRECADHICRWVHEKIENKEILWKKEK